MIKKILIVSILALYANNSNASAQPVEYNNYRPANVNQFTNAAILNKVQSQGFPVNDTRALNTTATVNRDLYAVGKGLISNTTGAIVGTAAYSGVSIGLAAIGVVGWPAILASGAIVGLGYGLYNLYDSGPSIDFNNSTNNYALSSPYVMPNYDLTAFNSGDMVWVGSLWKTGFTELVHSSNYSFVLNTNYHTFVSRNSSSNNRNFSYEETITYDASGSPIGYLWQYKYSIYNDDGVFVRYEYGNDSVNKQQTSYSCTSGTLWNSSYGCVGLAQLAGDFPATNQNLTYEQLLEALKATQHLSKNVGSQLLADIANMQWKNASLNPDYNGRPYSPTDPITEQDVNKMIAEKNIPAPQVGDLLKAMDSAQFDPSKDTGMAYNPQAGPVINGQSAPLNNPLLTPNTATQTGAEGQPELNLGDNPNIGPPTLENPPTGYQILDPIVAMVPGFKNFNLNLGGGSCTGIGFHIPIIEVDADFGAMCVLIDNNRSLIQAMMTLVFSIVAIKIVLSA